MADRTGRCGTRAERLFLELLGPKTPRGCSAATAEDLREAAALAFGRGLFLPVDRAIRRHAAAFPAGLVAGEYERSTRQLRRRHIAYALRYEREEQEAIAVLEAAAIPSAILKGSALSRQLYGEPHCRTSADIDLLVRSGDVPAADAALEAAGYRRDNDRPLSFWMHRLHHAVYRRPGAGLPVEIHWHFSIPGFFNLEPEELWAGVELSGLRGRLNQGATLLQLLMHHHLHGCAELRSLVDLVRALERHDEDPDRLFVRLESAGLLVVAGIARRQAQHLWGAQRWDLGGRGSRHAVRSGLLAAVTTRTLRPGRRPRASDRFLHALVHRLGLDSPRRVIASCAKTLLPSPAEMRALSGKERGGLAGYVQYFRWRLGGAVAGNTRRGRSVE